MSQRNNNNTGNHGSTTFAVLAAAGIGAFIGYLGHSLFSESEEANNGQRRPMAHGSSSRGNSVPIQPDKKCVICQEELNSPLEQLPCSHIFHQNCLLLWLNKSASCPTCRNTLSVRQLNTYLGRCTG